MEKLINQNCPAVLPKTAENTAIATESGDLACVVFGTNHRKQADIFAAAPELFDALRMVMKDCKDAATSGNTAEYDAISAETFHAIVAAITKAKGGGNE